MKERKKPTKIIRLVYLYIFTALGLILIVIGGIGLLNLGLKSLVFPSIHEDPYRMQPPIPYGFEKVRSISDDNNFTEQERNLAKQWLKDYDSWKKTYSEVDYKKIENYKSAATNIAILLIGIPLYLFHWRLVRKE